VRRRFWLVLGGFVLLCGLMAAPVFADTAPVNTALPTIDGTADVDQTLHASPGTWTGAPAPSFAYQWQKCNATPYATEVLADIPLAYWRLGDFIPSTSAADATANHFNGTYTNGPLLGAGGLLTDDANSAVTFDGANDVVTTTLTNTAADVARYTLEAWIKRTGTATIQQVVVGSANGVALSMAPNASTIRVTFWNGTAWQSATSAASVTDGVRHHVVGTWDAATLRIYVDGVLSGSSVPTGTPAASTTGMAIGNTGTTNGFGGTIDEVAFYRSPLSATRIAAHYTAGVLSCQSIAGATAQDYRVASTDRGSALRVVVTATNAAGTASASSTRTSKVDLGAPVNDAPPSLAGSFEQGQTITGSIGQWSGAQPLSYSYQWQRCGEKNAVLSLNPMGYWRLGELAGTTAVDATGHGNSGTYFGTPTLGVQGALNADPDTAAKFDGVRTGVTIAGTYPTGTAPASVAAWAKPNGFPGSGGYGTIVGMAGPLRIKVSSSRAVVVTTPLGIFVSGTTLTIGTWAHVAAASDGTNITLYVNGTLVSTFVNVGGNKVAGYSGIGVNNGTEWFNGTVDEAAIFGSALTAAQVNAVYNAGFNENSLAGCSNIAGATGTTYAVGAADEGSKLAFAVTATNSSGTASATSDPKVVRSPGPKNVALPAITGTPVAGQILTASAGDWDGAGTIAYAYQWKTCGYQDTVLTDSPSGYWRFAEQGDAIAADATGNRYSGQYSGASNSTPGAINGEGDAALVGGSVAIPGIGALASGPPFSVETWLKPGSDDLPNNTSVASGYGWSLKLVDVGTTTNIPQFDVEKYDSINMVSTHGIARGTGQLTNTTHWYHLIGVYTGAAVQVYVDGTLVGSVAFSGQVRHDGSGSVSFYTNAGAVDEGAYYRLALSAAQVSTHAAAAVCTNIAAATASTYTVAAADAGKRVSVTVTAANAQGSTAASSPTVRVAGSGAPLNTSKPTITDDKNTVGDALTATAGTWSSSSAVTYAYQWQRCSYATTILADHPAAYWPLDEPAGPKGEDASGNNNGGTYAGTPGFGVPGALADSTGTAVRMNGGSGSLSVPDSGSLHMGQGFTIEAWVKLNAGVGGAVFKQPEGFALSVFTNEIRLWYSHFVDGDPNPNPHIADSTTGVPMDGLWHHVVAEKAGNVGYIYLDGVDVTTSYADQSVSQTPGTLTIGGLSADVDEAAVYPSVLSSARVQAHYQAAQQACADIAGATGTGYTLATADIGKTVRVKVTATNTGGSTTVASGPTAPVIQQGGLQLDAPKDGAKVRTTTPPLSMIPLGGTTDYQFEIDQDDRFTGGAKNNSGWLPSTPTYAVPASWKLKDGGTYYWHARTRSATGVVSPWVGPRSFTVELKMLGLGDWPTWSNGPLAVNEINGNLVFTAPAPSFPTAAMSMSVAVAYNSQSSKNDGLGGGWTFTGGNGVMPGSLTSLSATSGLDGVDVNQRDGGTDTFSHVGASNVYTPGWFPHARLNRSEDGSFTLTTPDGSVYVYGIPDPATGVSTLTSSQVVQATAGADKLTYTFSGTTLTKITDVDGRSLTITWHSVSASGCPDAFVCVTGPDGVTWKYIGNGTGGYNGRLARVNDGVRDLYALTYDASGRMIKIQNANDLNPAAASPGYNPTHSIQIGYDGSSRVASVSNGPITGQTPATSTWTFAYVAGPETTSPTAADHTGIAAGTVRQADGYATVTPPNQQGVPSPKFTKTSYDEFDRTIEVVDPLGNATRTGWTLKGQVGWTEDAEGNPTDKVYDATSGVMLSTTTPDPDGPGPLGRPTTSYRYDENAIGDSSSYGPVMQGLAGSYYSTTNLAGRAVAQRADANVDFTWGSGGPGLLGGQADNFSVRWTGELIAPQTGDYVFSTYADAGTNLVIDSFDAIKDWGPSGLHTKASQALRLKAGRHTITLDYHDTTGSAQVHFYWQCASCATQITKRLVPASALRPGWHTQTSTVTPGGRVAFAHFARPWADRADYDLRKSGATAVITSYAYDAYGRLTRSVMPKGNAARAIQADGTLAGDPDLSYSTSYTYYGATETAAPPPECGGGGAIGQAGQLKSRIPRGVHASTSVYNATGDAIARTDASGTTCSTFDGDGSLVSQIAPGEAQPTTYTYDPSGSRRTTRDATGTVTDVFDESGRVVSTTDAAGATIALRYDAAGDVITETATPIAGGAPYVTMYAFDAAGQMTSLTDPAARTYTFAYTRARLLRATQYPNATFAWNDYDAAAKSSAAYNRHGLIPSPVPVTAPADASPIVDTTYTRDVDGRVTSEMRKVGTAATESRTYTYDALARLASVARSNGASQTFSYDLDSNRTTVSNVPVGGGTPVVTSYAYDRTAAPGLDELSSTIGSGTTTSYQYNADGDVVARGGDVLTWDGRGRLRGGTFGSAAVQYGFDPVGHLVTRAGAAGGVRYVYGGNGNVDYVVSGGAVVASTVTGPAGPLAEYAGPPSQASALRYRYYDGRGNVAADLTASASTVFDYGAFGDLQQGQAPPDTRIQGWAGAAQKQLDTTSGLIEMGVRQYDPTLGRFLSVDPIDGGSANAYDYAFADPVNQSDLSGAFTCLIYAGPVGRIRNPAPGTIFKRTTWLLVTGGYITCQTKQPLTVSWFQCIHGVAHGTIHCDGGFSFMLLRHHTHTHAFAPCEDNTTDIYFSSLLVTADSALEFGANLDLGPPLRWSCPSE
jgi:RHS repeat-associated protein